MLAIHAGIRPALGADTRPGGATVQESVGHTRSDRIVDGKQIEEESEPSDLVRRVVLPVAPERLS
jgi:hypothetical protein